MDPVPAPRSLPLRPRAARVRRRVDVAVVRQACRCREVVAVAARGDGIPVPAPRSLPLRPRAARVRRRVDEAEVAVPRREVVAVAARRRWASRTGSPLPPLRPRAACVRRRVDVARAGVRRREVGAVAARGDGMPGPAPAPAAPSTCSPRQTTCRCSRAAGCRREVGAVAARGDGRHCRLPGSIPIPIGAKCRRRPPWSLGDGARSKRLCQRAGGPDVE